MFWVNYTAILYMNFSPSYKQYTSYIELTFFHSCSYNKFTTQIGVSTMEMIEI